MQNDVCITSDERCTPLASASSDLLSVTPYLRETTRLRMLLKRLQDRVLEEVVVQRAPADEHAKLARRGTIAGLRDDAHFRQIARRRRLVDFVPAAGRRVDLRESVK